MRRAAAPPLLPVVVAPLPDELLSSWIDRHAAFYGVATLAMLRHCLPAAISIRAVDLGATDDQLARLSRMFGPPPARIREMTFTDIPHSLRRFICPRPSQSCSRCQPDGDSHAFERPVRRGQLLGWRITCGQCGQPLIEFGAAGDRFHQHRYWQAALRGEKLLDDEGERGIRNWSSPAGIAKLLLMRRSPKAIPFGRDLGSWRLLGVIVPEFDRLVADHRTALPVSASAILPLTLRPALLAGVAIVERAGPMMLEMLERQMLGENRARFAEIAGKTLTQIAAQCRPEQLQLI